MQTLSFVNQKGGVGKTTSCLNVGAGLSRAGKRVLLIDADPQGNLTISAGVKLGDDTPTVYDVLKGSVDINAAIVPGDYDILPADIMLSGADIELASVPGREMILKEAIGQLKKPYDYVLIDCPPSLSVITLMALTASSSVIVPVQAHYLALNGIAQLRDTIELVRKRMNPALVIGGVIVTQYDHRRLIDKEVLESLTEAFPGKVFKTTISNSVALVEAPSYGKDIFKYKPNSKPAAQYEAIVGEILKGDRNNG